MLPVGLCERRITNMHTIMFRNKPVTLENKDYVRSLGILIDSHLTFKYHIEHIIVK